MNAVSHCINARNKGASEYNLSGSFGRLVDRQLKLGNRDWTRDDKGRASRFIRKMMVVAVVAFPGSFAFNSAAAEIDSPAHQVGRPTVPEEMLKNVKYFFDRQLFLEKAFYTEARLKTVFGADEVHWRVQNDPTKQWVELADFREMVPSRNYNGMVLAGVSASMERTEHDNGKVTGRLSLKFYDDERLNFESVQRIFGTGWEYDNELPSPHSVVHESKAKHGNSRIFFRSKSQGVSQEIWMEFSPNANLYVATFRQEK